MERPYSIGVDVSQANLYQFLLTDRATYVLHFGACNLTEYWPGSSEHRTQVDTTIVAIKAQLHDLYLRVPGISTTLVVSCDGVTEEDIACQIELVKAAVEALVETQQVHIQEHMQCGNSTTARLLMYLSEVRVFASTSRQVRELKTVGGKSSGKQLLCQVTGKLSHENSSRFAREYALYSMVPCPDIG